MVEDEATLERYLCEDRTFLIPGNSGWQKHQKKAGKNQRPP